MKKYLLSQTKFSARQCSTFYSQFRTFWGFLSVKNIVYYRKHCHWITYCYGVTVFQLRILVDFRERVITDYRALSLKSFSRWRASSPSSLLSATSGQNTERAHQKEVAPVSSSLLIDIWGLLQLFFLHHGALHSARDGTRWSRKIFLL